MLKRFLIAVLLMGAVTTGAVAETIVDRIVAVANGEIITLFDLDERLKPMLARFEGKPMGEAEQRAVRELRGQVLDAMVDDILINQEAERLGVEVSDVEVENQIKQVRQQNGLTPEQFKDQLLLEGMTREMYARKLREDILKHRIIGFMVKRKVVITDEEIEAYYNAHPEESGSVCSWSTPKSRPKLSVTVLSPVRSDLPMRPDSIPSAPMRLMVGA